MPSIANLNLSSIYSSYKHCCSFTPLTDCWCLLVSYMPLALFQSLLEATFA